MTGHCSKCGKVWTLNERQGVCKWCGQSANLATTTTKPRRLKSIRSRKRNQENNGNNGYDQLPDQHGWIATKSGFQWAIIPWATIYNVASRFAHKAKAQDTADLLHDMMEGLGKVARRKIATGEDFSEPAMYRTAEHIKDWYWYKQHAYYSGLDCRHCSKAQRAKCRYNWAHSDWAYSDCHRAIQLESINRPIIDSEGNETELAQLIADDNALDIPEWIDKRTFFMGAPIRLKMIAKKRSEGEKLTGAERKYLTMLRKKHQKALI